MQIIISVVTAYFISQANPSPEPNPTKKECISVINDSRLELVLCTKLQSLSDLSQLMQPNWVDVAVLNRPSFPFAVDGEWNLIMFQ